MAESPVPALARCAFPVVRYERQDEMGCIGNVAFGAEDAAPADLLK